MNKKLFLLISLLCLTAVFFITCSAESGTSPHSPEEQVEQFFKTYREDTDRAVTQLFRSNKNVDVNTSDLAAKLKDVVGKIGYFNGYDLIVKRKAGDSMILYSYLAKHDAQPLRFTFVFYKPKDTWQIYNFEFGTEVDKELKRAAEIYLLDETYVEELNN
ncbi:hypothetical protein [uncultured Pontibacter sp.]|uniref:hypothetical protein n=1 Tax=uncultured Pontibacter sp. TaxID=453356 RepID=UPI00260605D4|nr:hypothetical protein [uncultured Pontibacter sp.]